jgi:NAD(P)-dependent dehydrogenase (short-subunit alcohol dehydrogenase family)
MTDELFDLTGKVALVTGGTSGIGRMIATGFVRRGVRTYITGRDLGAAEAVASELAANGDCRALAADLADPDAPARLIADLAGREERLHILVNNAGAAKTDSLAQSDPADWDEVLGVNVRAPFFLVREALPLLRAAASASDPARVISIGSIGGLHVPNWEAHAYGASKAALHHLTRSLAKKLGREAITVNAIAPGPFPSRVTKTESEGVQASVKTYIPLERPGQAEDVQGVTVFLSSRAGAYVNGTTIPLEGGYLAAL